MATPNDIGPIPLEILEQIRRGVDEPLPELFITAAEFASQTSGNTKWIVSGLAAEGGMTNIDAKIKTGKTTFIMEMIQRVLDGEPFLGLATIKTHVVYLTEQAGASFKQALSRAKLLGRDDLHLLFWNRVFGKTWEEVAMHARDKCKAVGAKLLVVDTVGQFAGFAGDGENSSGAWLEALRPLQAIQSDGVCVFNSVHGRKSGGEVGDSARGSSAGGGVADILLSLRRPEGNHGPNLRKIESLSRFDETPHELIIELTDEGYMSRGDSDAVALEEARVKLEKAIPDTEGDAMSVTKLAEETGAASTTLKRILDADPRVVRTGTGKRGNPYLYYRPKVSSQDSFLPNAVPIGTMFGNKPTEHEELLCQQPLRAVSGSGDVSSQTASPRAGRKKETDTAPDWEGALTAMLQWLEFEAPGHARLPVALMN